MSLSTIPYLELVASIYGTIFVGFGILYFVNVPKAISFFGVTYPPPAPATTTSPSSTSATTIKKDKDNKDDKEEGSDATAATLTLKRDLAAAKLAIDTIAIAYGVRDIFMGVAIYAASLFGTRMTLGCIVVSCGFVAFMDGVACFVMGTKAEMNHWNYAPVLVVLGGVCMGGFDWLPLENPFVDD